MESEISAMFKQVQIVDGQQRLTTSFIFLLALKAAALEKGEKDTAGMIDDYYLYNRHASEQAKLRLKPTVSDDDVYAKLIYGSAKDLDRKEKDSNVYRNYDFIYQRILEFSKKYSLLSILDTLGRIDLLIFPLSETDNAQQIFESINSTGAPLTSADLIRNYVLMNDTNEVQERNYKLYWQPLESYFPESRRLEEFFRYYLAAKTYNLLNRRDVYDGFKDYWNSSMDSKEQRMREIFRYCRFYNEVYAGPADHTETEAVLKEFRRNESHVPAPFLMEMFRMEDDGIISTETLGKLIRLVDTYLMRRSLIGNDTNALNRYFPQLLRSVLNSYRKQKGDVYEITKLYLVNYNRGKAFAMPTNDQLKSQMREINAYSLMCIRPILERIEHYGATAEVDTANLNIEHIMPQHPNAYWKKAANAKDDDEYTFYANLIGNLTLCAEYDNTRMGNQDFSYKKKILSKTLHIRMNTEILQKENWTPKEIMARCDELANLIIKIYPYVESDANTAETRDDDIIVLSAPSVNAKALYHNAKSIEILSGTTMHSYGPQEMKTMRSLCRDMLAMGVLSEDENGQIQFEKNYRFHDLNTAAQFLLHRGGDNVSAWTRENGTAFSESSPDFVNEKKEQLKPETHSEIQQKKTAVKNQKSGSKTQKTQPKSHPVLKNHAQKASSAVQKTQSQQKNNSAQKNHQPQSHSQSKKPTAAKKQTANAQKAYKPVHHQSASASSSQAKPEVPQKNSAPARQKVHPEPQMKPQNTVNTAEPKKSGNHFVEFLKTLAKK